MMSYVFEIPGYTRHNCYYSEVSFPNGHPVNIPSKRDFGRFDGATEMVHFIDWSGREEISESLNSHSRKKRPSS
jgi:hypothetical protein